MVCKQYGFTEWSNIYDLPDISVYPNPVSDRIIISSPISVGPTSQLFSEVSIIDLNGKTVFNSYFSGYDEIPVHALAPGLYFVQIIQGDNKVVKKVIINP